MCSAKLTDTMLGMAFRVPATLAVNCKKSPERMFWLERLPSTIEKLEEKWSFKLGPAFDGPDVSCSFVAPVECKDGSSAILKIGMPHFEAQHESDGLRVWSGDPTARLLEFDVEQNGMLLERCEPGSSLREVPLPEQDKVIAALLRRLWRQPPSPHPFRPLSALMTYWSQETETQKENWPDGALVCEGLRLFHELPRTAPTEVMLATDLHAGNVLRAQREPWLVIDPKPFIGDPAYDATQHLFNNFDQLCAHPFERIHGLADLLDVDRTRLHLWTFARLAAEPRDSWHDHATIKLARALAPK
jgi:streptomycin 6-kinase